MLDALLGTVVALAIALIIATDQGGERPPDLVAYLFAAGFGGLMLLHRRLPRTMLVATVLGLFAYYALGYPAIGVAVPVVAALFATADAGRTRWAVGAAVVVFAVSMSFRVRGGEDPAVLVGYESVSNTALLVAAIALGSGRRVRRIRAAQEAEITRLVARSAVREAALAQRAERERLSRDLHDTLGHALSVISLHAGVAGEAIGRDDAAAGEAVDRIRAAGARSLQDLRAMVRILRTDGDRGDGAPLSLAAVADLVEAARRAGIEVTTDLRARPAELSPPVEAAAYRVVQESITNLVRHSGAARATVGAVVRDGVLHLDVVDDGRGPAVAGSGGHGLAGMAERVHLLGGTLSAGPAEGRGFAVRARVPARLPA